MLTELTWGDALVLKVHHTRVGLKPFVEAIQAAVGRHIGTRPTFAKLYEVRDVSDLSEIEAYRAWLLLTAMGIDPDDWGIRASVVPPATDADRLQDMLTAAVRDQVRGNQGLEGGASISVLSRAGRAGATTQGTRPETPQYRPLALAA